MPLAFAAPEDVMQHAIGLALRGEGRVEPNPMVGAVLVDDQRMLIADGFHPQFGGPHAEVQALRSAGARARGATLYVTLEPCCHFGKTPPCTRAVIDAGVTKVIVGLRDPFPQVAGQGIAALRDAGIAVEAGLLEASIRQLNAPFLKLTETGLPYVHAKWAMTLDGKIAARTGASRWISGEASRAVVHRLRGRMDAILIGVKTALADDPLLTTRPPGPRTATRIVLDSRARLPSGCNLLKSVAEGPVLVVVSPAARGEDVARLQAAGAEPLLLPAEAAPDATQDGAAAGRIPLPALLAELGKRCFTNVLVEGGSELLGSFFDAGLIDEVHAFIAPKLLGGTAAKSPVGGVGLDAPSAFPQIDCPRIEFCGDDIYVHGRVSVHGQVSPSRPSPGSPNACQDPQH